ncbi:hypothetical protein KAJ27_15615 [bacterium]|nr:hypothetical protein [bacterium]
MSEINKELFKNFVLRLKKDRGKSEQYLTQILVKMSSQLGIQLASDEIEEIIKETFSDLESQ